MTPSSQLAGSGVLAAAALLKWPEAEALRLGELQFLLSPEVKTFLNDLPQLLRRLPTVTTRERRWSEDRIDGAIQWGPTAAARASSGNSRLYVSESAQRNYQAPEGELMVAVLDSVVRTAQETGWADKVQRGWASVQVRNRLDTAQRLQGHSVLAGIERNRPADRVISKIRSGRDAVRFASLLAAYDKLVRLVEQVDRESIREAIEDAGLVTSIDSTLFELLVTFQVINCLRTNSWTMHPFYTFGGKVKSEGRHPDGRQLQLWYQSAPKQLLGGNLYRQILASHRVARIRDLRPDLVLHWDSPSGDERWLLIECKQTSGQAQKVARDALTDLFTYRRVFDPALATVRAPYGLGVIWGEGLDPAVNEEIVLCTPDTLAQAVRQIVV
ncbi:hypothetical protein [Herbidospora daliensis]|uniref:hypothetical protein n=1 Tax=Herbidospora daliensis TaxID=295585 RepID=UPI0012FC340C|nr:hypothetical protein [Herbidospora daliensis]